MLGGGMLKTRMICFPDGLRGLKHPAYIAAPRERGFTSSASLESSEPASMDYRRGRGDVVEF